LGFGDPPSTSEGIRQKQVQSDKRMRNRLHGSVEIKYPYD
jgi:hypothetical protein